MDLRRICVFGAGAIGGRRVAKFATAGYEVAAAARGPQLEALRTSGVALRQSERACRGRVGASQSAADLGAQPHSGTVAALVQNGIPWWCAPGLGMNRPGPPDRSRLDPGGGPERAIVPACMMGGVVHPSNTVVATLMPPCGFAPAAGLEAPALEQLAAIAGRLAARKGLYAPA